MRRVRTVHGGTEEHTQVISVDRKDRTSGAYHGYAIYLPASPGQGPVAKILFQRRGVAEVGVNGCSNEDLLAVVKDRLECFQKGKFACRENERALYYIECALDHLHARTADRKARGVEGKRKR